MASEHLFKFTVPDLSLLVTHQDQIPGQCDLYAITFMTMIDSNTTEDQTRSVVLPVWIPGHHPKDLIHIGVDMDCFALTVSTHPDLSRRMSSFTALLYFLHHTRTHAHTQ